MSYFCKLPVILCSTHPFFFWFFPQSNHSPAWRKRAMAAPARVRAQVRSVPSSAWITGDSPSIIVSSWWSSWCFSSLYHSHFYSLSMSREAWWILSVKESQITTLLSTLFWLISAAHFSWVWSHVLSFDKYLFTLCMVHRLVGVVSTPDCNFCITGLSGVPADFVSD